MSIDLSILREPRTGAELYREGDALVSVASGQRHLIVDGIPTFLDPRALGAQNARFRRMYDRIARGYDLVENVYFWLKRLDRRAIRAGYLDALVIPEGGRVLEVSIGTGINLQWLPSSARVSGLDLSINMLRRAARAAARQGRDVTLVHGQAEALPFATAAFDCVFHFGGINFFDDRAGAIREMVRVARPGTVVVVSDETEKHVRETYEREPGTGRYFTDRREPVRAPLDLLPEGLNDVRYQEFWEGRMYAIRFRTPG